MRRTWFVTVAGSVLVLFAVFREVARFFIDLSNFEGPYSSAAVLHELPRVGASIVIGTLACVRIWFLISSKPRPYFQIGTSWIALVVGLLLYLWFFIPTPISQSECTESGICFGIYDMSDQTDFVAFAGIFFMLFSVIRAAATAIFVAAKYRYK